MFDSSNLINWYVNYSAPAGYRSNNYCGINQFFKLKPNTSYTISTKQNVNRLFMPLYDKDYNILRQAAIINGKQVTFTTNSIEQYAKMCFSLDGTTTMKPNNYKEFIQLEEGTTATSYVPHQEQNLPFTFAEGQFLATGESLEDEGRAKNEVQILLDGTEKWIKKPNTNNTFQFSPGFITKTGLCTHYTKFINGTEIDTKEGIYLSNTVTIIITDLRFTTVEEFKQWLAEEFINNPVMLQLVTSTSSKIIPYNETQQVQYNNIKANASSYDDITYITSTSDELGFDMKAIAVADANKVIDSLDTRLLALEGNTNQSKSLNVSTDTKNITKETAEETAENAENSAESEE